MQHRQMFVYMAVAMAAVAAVSMALGASFAAMPFVVMPLMMLFMMRSMSGHHSREDHTGHGCEHDPTRSTDRSTRPPTHTTR